MLGDVTRANFGRLNHYKISKWAILRKMLGNTALIGLHVFLKFHYAAPPSAQINLKGSFILPRRVAGVRRNAAAAVQRVLIAAPDGVKKSRNATPSPASSYHESS